jgi:hypothetical protein
MGKLKSPIDELIDQGVYNLLCAKKAGVGSGEVRLRDYYYRLRTILGMSLVDAEKVVKGIRRCFDKMGHINWLLNIWLEGKNYDGEN